MQRSQDSKQTSSEDNIKSNVISNPTSSLTLSSNPNYRPIRRRTRFQSDCKMHWPEIETTFVLFSRRMLTLNLNLNLEPDSKGTYENFKQVSLPPNWNQTHLEACADWASYPHSVLIETNVKKQFWNHTHTTFHTISSHTSYRSPTQIAN